MSRKQSSILDQFVPSEYYEAWAIAKGIDLRKFPYIFLDYDPALQKRVPHAVFNFYVPTVDEQPVAAAIIVYKSCHSKTQFRRLIYL